jgi:ribosomal protein S18 acetylase RimI-like enzyme
MPDERWSIRRGTVDDARVVALHRVRMMAEIGPLPGPDAARLLEETERWFVDGIPRGDYRAWLAETDDDEVIAGVGVHLRPIIPRPAPRGGVLSGLQGLVVNVWVEPAWRRRGIAEALMHELIADAQSTGLASLVLHASDAGRPLYERLGFLATNEMRLDWR